MLFNSYEFIFLFLPITFFIYFFLNSKRLTAASKIFLIVSSLFFYAWWNIIYLPLIIISILFNYTVGLLLTKRAKYAQNQRKLLLIIGIAANIGLLGYFKYSDFFISNVNFLFSSNISLLNLTLPLAISFFSFQQIAYLIDSYRNETKEYSFINYCIFITFFPQLIAGPIVHHKEMMPYFASPKTKVINHKNISKGIYIFSIGLFKKVVIADSFSTWATNGFDTAQALSLLEAWATSLSYTFQLYFDFSGYCDMAIGAALLFNIKLPINFNSPYKATNIQDFWRRWHITLSRFLRDYIYIPLGGNRHGDTKTCANLMTTFLIGGIWHGAGWTFVFWGFLHGLALVVFKIWSMQAIRLNKILAWIITFNFINIAWIFFRAKEWQDAIKVIKGMFGFSTVTLPNFLSDHLHYLSAYGVKFGNTFMAIGGDKSMIAYIFFAFILVLTQKNSIEKTSSLVLNHKTYVVAAFMFACSIILLKQESEFLYFNF